MIFAWSPLLRTSKAITFSHKQKTSDEHGARHWLGN